MQQHEEEMVAYALEIDPKLLPHVPELLADLEELGSDAEQVVEVLRGFDLPPTTSVIDLGCGKGAVAVEIADELGFQVLGVELFAPFIEACRRAADAAGVADLCAFRHGNIADLAGEIEPADVVVFTALGDVLGPLDQTVEVIRRYVKPGGLMLIGDGYLEAGAPKFPRFEGYVGREESLRRLRSWGDDLVREITEAADPAAPNAEEGGSEEAALILARAREIAQRHPELAADLFGFAREQAAEYDFLAADFTSALWVLRKAPHD